MNDDEIVDIQNHLVERRGKLSKAIKDSDDIPQLVDLLHEVDAALERIGNGTYGKCIICKDPIEKERLLADPLITFCLDHLDKKQQKLLEQELELASQVQNNLLPQNNFTENGYEVSYRYLPAGPVSGDYCDLVVSKNGEQSLYFILGDVTGKGIAASMLVNHIYAIFHSLMELKLPLDELVNKANSLFCEGSLYSHFATMVCGRAFKEGMIEICNAGHCLPILINKKGISGIDSTGMPLGLFCTLKYNIKQLHMEPGDILLLYSDGLSEARNGEEEFGVERINKLAELSMQLSAEELINLLIKNLNSFVGDSQQHDDLTIMAIKRVR